MSEPSEALQERRRASLARIEKLAFWLDDAFRVPIIGSRFGIDGIVGLLPFAGDFVGLVLSTLLIGEAIRLGAPKRLWLRMAGNLGIDFVVGLIPIAGDAFDIFYKVNRRNQKLLKRWLAEATGEQPRGGSGAGLAMIGLCIGLGLTVTVGVWRATFG